MEKEEKEEVESESFIPLLEDLAEEEHGSEDGPMSAEGETVESGVEDAPAEAETDVKAAPEDATASKELVKDFEASGPGKSQDADAVKLFVGQISRATGEEELSQIFSPFGEVLEIVLIRDRATLASKGCSFVKFKRKEDAERAISEVHDKVSVVGMSNRLQVKVAGSEKSRQESKLFVGMLPRAATESDVREIFEKFGELEDIIVLRGPQGEGKGCGFVRFKVREEAISAINALNGVMRLSGSPAPLVVKFADAPRSKQKFPPLVPQYYHVPVPYVQSIGTQPIGLTQQMPYYAYQDPTMMGQAGMQPAYVSQQQVAYPAGYSVPGQPQMYYTPQYNQPQPTRRSKQLEGPPGANLFVLHIPNEWKDQDLMASFSPFGEVLSAHVYVDENTKESKGFGFVSYSRCEMADLAVRQMNGIQVGSRRIKVQLKSGGRSSSRPY